MRTVANTVALLLSAGAFSNETTIEVPQGSGVFPTVGQLNCLEEMGSGRFCAATYECADESGDLWGDLANHDGRRAIGVDSPVARERDCTITVDSKAAVRWFVGFSPDGRNGELVGLTAKHDAEPPVVRRVAQGDSGGSGSFLSWFVERYEIGDIVAEVRDLACGHLVEGTSQRESCLESDVRTMLGRIRVATGWESTPFTRCAAELRVDVRAKRTAAYGLDPEHPLTPLTAGAVTSLQERRGGGRCGRDLFNPDRILTAGANMCAVINLIANVRDAGSPDAPHEGYVEVMGMPERYADCRRLLEEQWEREGFGELQ